MLSLPALATGTIGGASPTNEPLFTALTQERYWCPATALPLVCMDGRHALPQTDPPVCGVALPGATITVVVSAAHALAQLGLIPNLSDLCELAANPQLGSPFPAGAHRAGEVSAHAPNSGCAAADLLPEILHHSRKLAVGISELGRACKLPTLDTGIAHFQTASNGRTLIDALERCGATVATLSGAHHEQMVVFNYRTGWTLDRPALAQALGPDLQVFLIDAWAYALVAQAAVALANTYLKRGDSEMKPLGPQALPTLQAAAGSFTFAALLALCAPGMPILRITDPLP